LKNWPRHWRPEQLISSGCLPANRIRFVVSALRRMPFMAWKPFQSSARIYRCGRAAFIESLFDKGLNHIHHDNR